MEIVKIPLDMLVPDPENPRSHPKENIDAIKASLTRFQQVAPLVVHDETSIVVAGNGTMTAMKELGWTEAECVLYSGTLDETRALGVVLNRTAELGIWDEKVLGKIIAGLKDASFDSLGVLGFNSGEMEDLERTFKGEIVTVGDVDPYQEWQGMPEYTNENKQGFRDIVIHFKDAEAVEAFAQLVEQNITDATKYLWYPEIEIESAIDKRYGSES
jgi:hypothetical protein